MIDLPGLISQHWDTSQRAHGRQRHPSAPVADAYTALRGAEADPLQMFAWVDLMFAAIEGGLRSGATPFALAQAAVTRAAQMGATCYPPRLAQDSLQGPAGRQETIQEELVRLRKLERDVEGVLDDGK